MRLIDRLTRRFDVTGGWEGTASGAAVFTTTYGSPDQERIQPGLTAFANQSYSGNSIVFGAILARLSLFSQARFAYQDLSDEHLWGADVTDGRRATGLRKLEHPWPNGSTDELLARMLQDADLGGNSYTWDNGEHLVRLRPDQTTIVSQGKRDTSGRKYRRVVGYWNDPNPNGSGQPSNEADYYDVSEIAHWAPLPDPLASFRGMSWLTPVAREIRADSALTDYKLKYLDNSASPNILIKYKQKLLPDTIDALRERMHARYGGVDNAFKTLILDQGADATVIGNSLEQMNFTTVQAAGENRILLASGVPGIVVGSKEGLMAATYSNYKQAMRRFSDITMWQLWPSACAALSTITDVPTGSRLWMRTSDIPALQEDEKERADTTLVKASAVAELTKFGYDPKSIILAVESGDFSLLTHSGLAIDIMTEVPKAAPQPLTLAPPSAASQAVGDAVKPKQIPAGVNGTGGSNGNGQT